MRTFTLNPATTALLIVDMQEKIFAPMKQGEKVLHTIRLLIHGCQQFHIPVILTEQYPQGLGITLEPIQKLLNEQYRPWVKSTFSAVNDPSFINHLSTLAMTQWIVVGLETHICVLQTVKGLINLGKEVVVLNHGMTARTSEDHDIALKEINQAGARVSTLEAILFELLKDSQAPQFKAISQLVKTGTI